MDATLSPEHHEWCNDTLDERERGDLSNAFTELHETGHVAVGQEVSTSGNVHSIYDHLQATTEYWASKPLNHLNYGHMKHKQAYNLIAFKTKGRRPRSSLSSPERESNSQPDNVD